MDALGISRWLLEALLDRVKSAIREEAAQWQALERETVFIKDEFEMMKSFLNSTDGHHLKNQVARTWVGHVRDLSYDTEDSIEFALHLETKRSPYARMLPPFLRPYMVTGLDQAVAEMEALRVRAADVNRRNLRYNLIDNSGQQMPQNSAGSQRISDIFIKPTRDAFDKQNSTAHLTEMITTEDEGLQVISVCGTGGDLGNISIIKKAYDDPKICETFECRAWVKLVRPFSISEFIRSLFLELSTNSEQQGIGNVHAKMVETLENMIQYLIKAFEENAYLIVLEDLSSLTELNAIKNLLPDKNKGRVVVSTQYIEIASLCVGQLCQVSLLREFSADHSVYAFFKEVTRAVHQPTADRSLDDSRDLLVRDFEKRKLKKLIDSTLEGNAHRVVSVCGIAGVGKTFLVKSIVKNVYMDQLKLNCAWASAPHPFDIVDLCRRFDTIPTSANGGDIVGQCWNHLEQKQCLVVIDDLRSKEDWDLIKANLISRSSKSCIIVITREESVARHCTTLDIAVCIVKGLEADVALRLFEEVLKQEGVSNPDPRMMEEAGYIINKCGRLPKLVVALAKYFAKGPNIIQEMRRLNANITYELKISKGLDSFRDVFTTMHSTFQSCPQLLKKCIFYLSLFTESSIIRRSRLVRRWIAEGYCEGTDSNSMTEYADKLLGNLASLGMIDKPPQKSIVAGDMRVTSCQVNSLFLDYIISREIEDNIFLPLEVTVLQGEHSVTTIQRAGQHFAIGSSWKGDKFVLDGLDFSRLRSLTVSRDWRPFFISHRMRVLRVLDLEDTNVKDDDIKRIVEQLPRLKFLSLRRCTKVCSLPESLGDLKQLQTLDIRHTHVSRLPSSISKLRKLQYLRAGTSVALMDDEPSSANQINSDGIKVPKMIGTLLMSLQTLGVIDVSAIGSNNIQSVFKNLTQLRKLGVSGISRKNIRDFFSAINLHHHLESLSLQLHMDKDLDWLRNIMPPRNLRRLKMKVHVENFRHWSYLQVLGQIRRLQTLRLDFRTEQDVELQFSDRPDGGAWTTPNQFCELKVLEIACRSNLLVKLAEGEMKELEQLKVRSLEGSWSLNFSGMEHMSSLKHVCLKGSFSDTVKEELRQKFAQLPNKPFLKLD